MKNHFKSATYFETLFGAVWAKKIVKPELTQKDKAGHPSRYIQCSANLEFANLNYGLC